MMTRACCVLVRADLPRNQKRYKPKTQRSQFAEKSQETNRRIIAMKEQGCNPPVAAW
jgi:hypothetical protein